MTTCNSQAAPFSSTIVGFPELVEPATPLAIDSHSPASAERARLEAFIQTVYFRAYRAHIRCFYPYLLGITRPDTSFAAVAGIRPAGRAALFAEQYLDRPIERLLAKHGCLAAREAIVEVGNLAPASAGQARWLITALTAYLHAAGFSWVVFTAVPALHNAFQRLGLPLIELAPAMAQRLETPNQDDWGSYYEAHPRVYAGHIMIGYNSLNRSIGPRQGHLRQLWHDAQQAGTLLRRQHLESHTDARTSA